MGQHALRNVTGNRYGCSVAGLRLRQLREAPMRKVTWASERSSLSAVCRSPNRSRLDHGKGGADFERPPQLVIKRSQFVSTHLHSLHFGPYIFNLTQTNRDCKVPPATQKSFGFVCPEISFWKASALNPLGWQWKAFPHIDFAVFSKPFLATHVSVVPPQ